MFAAFGYPEYRVFWIGYAMANTGTWMEVLGHGWLAVLLAVRAGRPELVPLYVGIVGLARAIPGIAFGLLAGAIIDRTDRRQLIVATQLAAALLSLFLAVLVIGGAVSIVWLAAVAALRSVLYSFDMPARQAIVPRLVARRDLMSAIGLHQASFNGPQVIGPAVGGVIIAATDGVAPLFVAIAAAYVVVTFALLRLQPLPPDASAVRGSMLGSVRDGVAFMASDPVVKWNLVLAGTFAFVARPFVFLLPAFVATSLGGGSAELSGVMAASGIGAFGGSLLVAALGDVRHRGRVQLLAAGLVGIGIAVFALQRQLLAAVLLAAAIGLMTIVFQGLSSTVLQTSTPDPMLGRVMSVFALLYMGVLPLGQFALGALGSAFGVETLFVAAGVVTLGAALYAGVRLDAVRDLVARPYTAEAASPMLGETL